MAGFDLGRSALSFPLDTDRPSHGRLWHKPRTSGTTGETACPTAQHQQFASPVGQAFSLA